MSGERNTPVKKTSRLGKFGRVVLVMVVMLALGELIARFFLTSPSGQNYDAELGWTWRPGAEILNATEGGATITINSMGLVDDEITEKGERYRILSFGNSFTEAIQVPLAENFTSRIEQLVPNTDVVNLARSGMGPAHYPAVLDRFEHLDPDLLLVAVGYGDVSNLTNDDVLVEHDAEGRITDVRIGTRTKDELKRRFEPILSRSALATYLMRRFKPIIMDWVAWFRGGDAEGDDLDPHKHDWRQARDRLAHILRTMKQTAPVVLLDLPGIAYRPDGAVRGALEEGRAFREAAALAEVPYIEVGDEFIARYQETGQPVHGFDNLQVGVGHLNAAGHEVVAQVVSRWLVTRQGDVAGGPAGGPPSAKPPRAGSGLTAVWATEGGDKITRDERRATQNAKAVISSVFDGSKVSLFGGRNEVVHFALVLEGGDKGAKKVSVEFDTLVGPEGARIATTRKAEGKDLYTWLGREIELFYVRYLQIKGLSLLTWGNYDERHVPARFRRPFGARGIGKGGWKDRPDAEKYYPDIAVPMELVPTFDVPARMSQLVWVDIYIPRKAKKGVYEGTVTIKEDGKETFSLPVALKVRDFTLPDEPSAPTMAVLGYGDINHRYLGVKHPEPGPVGEEAMALRDRHFLLAKRHKVSLIDHNDGPGQWKQDHPRPEWLPRLNGELFSPAKGYDGPGVNTGNGVYSVGTYGHWDWKDEGEKGMHAHLDSYAEWFKKHLLLKNTTVFLYLIDESDEYDKIEKWASWVRSNPGPGKDIKSMATLGLVSAISKTPSLDIPTSSVKVGPTQRYQNALEKLRKDPRKKFFHYNGARPGAGSLAIEDDGVAMRTWGWIQHKFGIDRWFVWETTYYNNFQGGQGDTNVFQQAHTFGGRAKEDHPRYGQTGWNYTNGDGVLFYPGTDKVFPDDSYGLPGPIASIRLKYWRRGIQDADYLAMAAEVDKVAVRKLVQKMVPKALWEPGVDNQMDPTYKHVDIAWPIDPNAWEKARAELADIIERKKK